MYPVDMQNSRRRFLATGAGAAVLALSALPGTSAFASPTVNRSNALAESAARAAVDPTDLVVDYLKQQGAPQYLDGVLDPGGNDAEGTEGGEAGNDPEAEGEFGTCGVGVSSLADMEVLLGGLPLERV